MKAVLFDFGGVFTASPFDAVISFAEELGADVMEVGRLVFGEYDRDTDHPWHCLERGEITLENARNLIAERARKSGLELDLYEFFSRFPQDGGLRQEMVDCVRQLRSAGYRTAVLTNNIAEFSAGWRSLLPVDALFDIVVDSSAEGLRKPNPEFYRLALRRLGGISPVESVFLDDAAGNIAAAAALGIRTVLVDEDIPRVLDELQRQLSS